MMKDKNAQSREGFKVLLLKLLLYLVEIPMDLILGYTFTGGTRKERKLASENYDRCAQVVRIVRRGKINLFWMAEPSDFLYVHERYVDLTYVANNPRVSLCSLSKTHAMFAVCDEGVDWYDTKRIPFVLFGQYEHSTRLIFVPIAAFHRLAERIGDPRVPVGLINMSGRCGSTLLAQMANRVPNTRSMSEPWPTVSLHFMYRHGKITPAEYIDLLRSSMRVLCKIEPGEKVDRIVVKMTMYTASQFPMLAELFPDFRLYFNTRHPKGTMPSFRKLTADNPDDGVVLRVASKCLGLNDIYPYTDGRDDYHRALVANFNWWRDDVSGVTGIAKMYSSVLTTYFDNPDIYDHVFLYENILADPKREASALCRTMGISEEHVEAMLEALGRDSQNETFGGRGNTTGYVAEEEDVAKWDEVFGMLGLRMKYNDTVEEYRKYFDEAKTKIGK